jgi:ankyrin repeat protein
MDLIDLCLFEEIKLDQIKLMLEDGEDINVENEYEETPLLFLCENKSVTLDLIRYMVENGADINHADWCENTPLIYLCGNKSVTLDLIKYMVEKGADINHVNDHGETPIILLIHNKSLPLEKKLEIINYMKKYIIDIDKEIEKIKQTACEYKEEIIEELGRVESTTKSAAKR